MTMRGNGIGSSLRHYLCFFVVLTTLLSTSNAQRFLRQGFSNSGSDLGNEMKLDDTDMSGLTREMVLMKDLPWELQPPTLEGIGDVKLKRHIHKYLNCPVHLSLHKMRGKYGLRAVGKMEKSGKKLRAFWRQSPPGKLPQLRPSEFLQASYDDAVRSRLFVVDFELLLPPLKGSKNLPSVVYSIAVEPGSMNPKALIPRGVGKVRVYPNGRTSGVDDSIVAGIGHVGVSMRAGLVDPSWAKGHRPAFRKGRSVGTI